MGAPRLAVRACAALLLMAAVLLSPPRRVYAVEAVAGAPDLTGLEVRVARFPQDTDASFELARAYARAGRFAEANAEYDCLLALYPEDVDLLFGKATALLAGERPREALPFLTRARVLAPAYEDVWRSETNALEALGDTRAAMQLLDAAKQQFPQSEWPDTRRERLSEVQLLRSGTRLSASAAYEDLSGAAPSWQSAALGLDVAITARTRIVAGLALEERFEQRDEQISLGLGHRLSPVWALELGAELTPDAELLAERALRFEVSRPVGRMISAGVRVRHSTYETVDVGTVATYIERGVASFRLGYALTTTKATDIDATLGHALRLARDYGGGSHITLSLARGDEAEAVAPGQVLVMQTTTAALSGIHWRSATWGISWSCGWTEQGELYERLGARLGVEHRF